MQSLWSAVPLIAFPFNFGIIIPQCDIGKKGMFIMAEFWISTLNNKLDVNF